MSISPGARIHLKTNTKSVDNGRVSVWLHCKKDIYMSPRTGCRIYIYSVMYVCVTQCKQTEKENHALFLENASITFVLKCSVCIILIIPWQTVAFENPFQM